MTEMFTQGNYHGGFYCGFVFEIVRACCISVMSHSLVAHQAPLSLGLSGQEDWSGPPCPPPGDLPHPGAEPVSPAAPALQVDSLSLSHQGRSLLSATVSIFLMLPSASMDCL